MRYSAPGDSPQKVDLRPLRPQPRRAAGPGYALDACSQPFDMPAPPRRRTRGARTVQADGRRELPVDEAPAHLGGHHPHVRPGCQQARDLHRLDGRHAAAHAQQHARPPAVRWGAMGRAVSVSREAQEPHGPPTAAASRGAPGGRLHSKGLRLAGVPGTAGFGGARSLSAQPTAMITQDVAAVWKVPRGGLLAWVALVHTRAVQWAHHGRVH